MSSYITSLSSTTVSYMLFNTMVSFAVLDTILSQKEPKVIRITTKWTLMQGSGKRQMGHRMASQGVVMLWEKRKPLGREMEKTQLTQARLASLTALTTHPQHTAIRRQRAPENHR